MFICSKHSCSNVTQWGLVSFFTFPDYPYQWPVNIHLILVPSPSPFFFLAQASLSLLVPLPAMSQPHFCPCLTLDKSIWPKEDPQCTGCCQPGPDPISGHESKWLGHVLHFTGNYKTKKKTPTKQTKKPFREIVILCVHSLLSDHS